MEFFILFLSLLNAISGILFLSTLSGNPPGLFFVLFIGLVLTVIGMVGFGLWLTQILKNHGQTFKPSPALKSWLQIAKGIDLLFVLGLVFRTFVFQPFLVDGNSMEPNYHNNEFLLVDRVSYKFTEPKRGQVIIFLYPNNPQEDYIKRIIGLPGETVSIENGQVLINGQKVNEEYLEGQTTVLCCLKSRLERTLGSEEYFVLGDNRDHSSDSREWGVLPRKNIIGKAWLVIYPLVDSGLVKNPQYTLQNRFSIFTTSPSSTWAKF